MADKKITKKVHPRYRRRRLYDPDFPTMGGFRKKASKKA